MSDDARPGVRVKVRFAGRDVDGYVLERVDRSDHDGRLLPLRRVVSAEPVLAPAVARLARAVADHYAGTLSDVLRLAVPPRHARAEQSFAARTGPGRSPRRERPRARSPRPQGPRAWTWSPPRRLLQPFRRRARAHVGARRCGARGAPGVRVGPVPGRRRVPRARRGRRGTRAVWTALPGSRPRRPRWRPRWRPRAGAARAGPARSPTRCPSRTGRPRSPRRCARPGRVGGARSSSCRTRATSTRCAPRSRPPGCPRGTRRPGARWCG